MGWTVWSTVNDAVIDLADVDIYDENGIPLTEYCEDDTEDFNVIKFLDKNFNFKLEINFILTNLKCLHNHYHCHHLFTIFNECFFNIFFCFKPMSENCRIAYAIIAAPPSYKSI